MPVLPLYVESLGIGQELIGLIAGVFTISAVLVRPPVGYGLDRYGRRGIYLVGLVLFVVTVFSYRWAVSVTWLIGLRLLQGLGWGASTTAAGTIVADVLPSARRAEGMGYYGVFPTLAMAVAPTLGLAMAGRYPFTLIFVIASALGLLALLLATQISSRLIPDRHEPQPFSWANLAEPKAFKPGMVMFFLTLCYGGVVTFIALYAEQRGIDNIGPYFAAYAVSLMIIRPLAGRIADTRGHDPVVIPGIVAVAIAMVVLALADGWGLFLLAGFLNGLGMGLAQPSLQAITIDGVAPQRRGAANATFFITFDLGIGIGSMLWGVVAAQWGYPAMYVGAAGTALVGLAIYIKSSPSREPVVKSVE